MLLPLLLALASLVRPIGGAETAGDDPFDALLLPWLEEAIDRSGLRALQPKALLATLERREGEHGQALAAKAPFATGERICIIPRSRLAKDSGHGLLAWHLAKHRGVGEGSRLWPYISSLPTHHSERPARWEIPPGLLHGLLQGSGFPEYVAQRERLIQADFELMQEQQRGAAPKFEHFRWAHDIVSTRHMAAPSNILMQFPLADMCNHADHPNVELKWETLQGSTGRGGEELVIKAVRAIQIGDELRNAYFQDSRTDSTHGTLTNWQSLELWGFTTPRTRKTAQVHVTPQMLSAALADVIGSDTCTDACAALVGENGRKFSQLIDHDGGLFGFARDTIVSVRDGNDQGADATADATAADAAVDATAAVALYRALLAAGLAGYPQTLHED